MKTQIHTLKNNNKMAEKQLMADKMRELTSTAEYRKCIKEIQGLQRSFSKKRYVHIANPSEQVIDQLRAEGFTVTKTSIKEYIQYRILL